jgi:hypothetical protein
MMYIIHRTYIIRNPEFLLEEFADEFVFAMD